MTIDKAYVRALVPSHIYTRGVQYYRERRANIIEASTHHLKATVRGTRPYQVEVVAHNGHLSTFCDCPKGAPCKHVVAALLEAAAHPHAATSIAAHTDNISTPRQLNAQAYFEKLTAAPHPESATAPGRWRLGFVIHLEANHWTVQAAKFYIKQDGGIGRRARITPNDLYDMQTVRSSADHAALIYLEGLQHSEPLEGQLQTHSLDKQVGFAYGSPVSGLIAILQGCLIAIDDEQNNNPPISFAATTATIRFRFERSDHDFVMWPYLLRGDLVGTRRRATLKSYGSGLRPASMTFQGSGAGGTGTGAGHTPPRLWGNFHALTSEPVWLLFNNELIRIENLQEAAPLLPFSDGTSSLRLTPLEMESFVEKTLPKLPFALSVDLPVGENLRVISKFDKRRLYLSENFETLRAELRFVYGNRELSGAHSYPEALHFDSASGACMKIVRDLIAEQQASKLVEESGLFPRAPGVFENEGYGARDWLLNHLPSLATLGFEIFGEKNLHHYRVRRLPPRVQVAVASGQDWFDLELDIDFEGVKLNIEELRRAFLHGSHFVRLADGSSAQLPEQWRQLFAHLFRFSKRDDKNLRLSRYHVTLIDQLFREANAAHADAAVTANLKKLRNFTGIRSVAVPRQFKGTLRTYQHAGLNWFYFLQEFGFGGCLADDMGLGKTIQALALLLSEKKRKVMTPSLIVAPTSVVFNWQNEIARFAPSLRVLIHTGSERRRGTRAFQDYDIVLTTYGTLRRDIAFLKDFDFHYVILDESQNIKNASSQTGKAARLLRCTHRLALTGTPLENSTMELWSQFAFLNPGLLGPLRQFQMTFARPIERGGDHQAAAFLQKLVFPFILRRTKEQVARELPPKVENTYYCVMGEQQRKLYVQLRDFYRAAILGQIERKGLQKSRMKVLAGLMRLRQVACHPGLLPTCRDFSDEVGKFQALQELLEDILAENHKVLIFSQFVQMLKIIRRHLDATNVSYEYLDGQTRHRQACVEHFQNDPSVKIFLISLRAGGTGLNLTAADYVIHYDPWWNPAVEMQATDRTHRIGQRHSVFSYKLITKETVEEKILELQNRKKQLVEKLIITDTGLFKQLSVEDITGLFS